MHTAAAQDIGPRWPCWAAVSRMWVNEPAPGDHGEHGDGQRAGDREQAAARRPGRPGGPSPASSCLVCSTPMRERGRPREP